MTPAQSSAPAPLDWEGKRSSHGDQKPMKEDLARLAGHTLTYGMGQVLVRVISMLLLPLFTTYLTPADYGVSAMLGLIAFVVTPIFGLGLGAVIGVFYYRSSELEHRAMVIWSGVAVLLVSSGLLMAGVVAFRSQISAAVFRSPRFADLIVITIVGVCCSLISTPLAMSFQFERMARQYVILSTLATAVGLLSSVVLVIFLGRGIRGLVEGTALAQAATLLLFVLPCARRIPPRVQMRTGTAMLRMGLAFVPSFAWLFLIQHGNKYILERLGGVDTLGIYTLGFNLGIVSSIAVSGFQNAWMPYFMSFIDRREDGTRLFGRVMTYYVFGFGVMSLVFFAVARPAVLILTQPAFHAAYLVVGCSAAAQFFTGIFSILLPPMYFANEVSYVSVVQGIAAVLAAAINWALILWFGLIGAAAGLALGSVLLPLLQYLWNVRRGERYIQPAYEWGRIGRFGLIYGAMAAAFMSYRTLALSLEITLAAAGSAVAVGAVVMLLSADEREAVRAGLREASALIRRRRTSTVVA